MVCGKECFESINRLLETVFAYSAIFSGILPMIVGYANYKQYHLFYKLVLTLITLSLVINVISICRFNFSLEWPIPFINGYTLGAIMIAHYLYISLLKKTKALFKLLILAILGSSLLFSAYYIFENGSDFVTNSSAITVYYVYHICSIIIVFLAYMTEHSSPIDAQVPLILGAFLIYYSSLCAIFVFFNNLDTNSLVRVYYFKWILTIILHCFIAFLLYQNTNRKDNSPTPLKLFH